MPTQTDTQSQIARKIKFAIQLLRETADLLESPAQPTTTKRYPRRPNVEPRDE